VTASRTSNPAPPSGQIRTELLPLLRLAGPLAANQAGIVIMSLVDIAIVGRVGPVALGAIGLANNVYSLGIIAIGLMAGFEPLIAQAIGAGHEARARHLLWQGIWAGVPITLLLSLLLIAAPSALEPLGVAHEIADTVRWCLIARMPGLPATVLIAIASIYLQAVGKPNSLVFSIIAANILNLLADLLLVFGGGSLPRWTHFLRSVPALGAPGSALATSLSLLLQLAIILCAVSRVSAVQSDVSRRPNFDEIRIAVRVGTPIGINRCADVGVLLVAGIVGGRIGSVDLAAHQIAMTLVNIIYTIAIGLAGAGAVRVAYAVGARDEKRLGLAGRVAFFSTLAIMLVLALPVLTLRTHIASLFTDRPSIIDACGPLIAWASLYLVVQGLKVVGGAVIRGVGNTRAILLPTLVGQYGVGLPIAIALALVIGDGMPGLWAGLTLGSSCTAIALVLVFRRLIVGSIVPLEARAQR